jgi:hypothetical protein
MKRTLSLRFVVPLLALMAVVNATARPIKVPPPTPTPVPIVKVVLVVVRALSAIL